MSDESTELVVVLDVCLGILSSRTEDDTVEDLMALAASGNCLRSRGTQMPIIVLCQSAHIPLLISKPPQDYFSEKSRVREQ